MTSERYELLTVIERARQAVSYLYLAGALGRSPGAVSMALTRAKRAGLVASVEGYFLLTQQGVDRLAWLRANAGFR